MKLKMIFVWYRSLAAPFSRSLCTCAQGAFYCRKLPSSEHAISTQFQCHEQHKKQSAETISQCAEIANKPDYCEIRFLSFIIFIIVQRQMMWENHSSCFFFFGWESFYVRAVTCEIAISVEIEFCWKRDINKNISTSIRILVYFFRIN